MSFQERRFSSERFPCSPLASPKRPLTRLRLSPGREVMAPSAGHPHVAARVPLAVVDQIAAVAAVLVVE
jgi:hypothetical protein